MAALPFAKYGIEKLFLFPTYQSRAEYLKATGLEPPEFDRSRPPKTWFDPAAEKSTKRTVLYNCVLATDEKGYPILDQDGKLYFEPMVLSKQEAATVNLIPGGASNGPGTDQVPVPIPMRPLEPVEELIRGFGGIIGVRNTSIAEEGPTSFTHADRELIRAIARKLGVPIQVQA